MAWLRIDDRMAEHPKLLALSRSDRWAWIELLCYCARQGTGGHVPAGVTDAIKHVTDGFLTRCLDLGLLDRDEQTGVLMVHDWDVYNAARRASVERQQRYRRRTRDVTGDVT